METIKHLLASLTMLLSSLFGSSSVENVPVVQPSTAVQQKDTQQLPVGNTVSSSNPQNGSEIEKAMVGTWVPQDKNNNISEQYSIEQGRHVYKSFSSGKLSGEGSWSLDDNGTLLITGKEGSYSLFVTFNKTKDMLTILDEESESVWIRVK